MKLGCAFVLGKKKTHEVHVQFHGFGRGFKGNFGPELDPAKKFCTEIIEPSSLGEIGLKEIVVEARKNNFPVKVITVNGRKVILVARTPEDLRKPVSKSLKRSSLPNSVQENNIQRPIVEKKLMPKKAVKPRRPIGERKTVQEKSWPKLGSVRKYGNRKLFQFVKENAANAKNLKIDFVSGEKVPASLSFEIDKRKFKFHFNVIMPYNEEAYSGALIEEIVYKNGTKKARWFSVTESDFNGTELRHQINEFQEARKAAGPSIKHIHT